MSDSPWLEMLMWSGKEYVFERMRLYVALTFEVSNGGRPTSRVYLNGHGVRSRERILPPLARSVVARQRT